MAEVSLKSTARHLGDSFGLTRTPTHDGSGIEDPFHDPLMLAIAIAFVLMLVVILALTGLMHWGVEYQSPPWNSHAYPPPIAH